LHQQLKPESVITIKGKVVKREKGTENLDIKTGEVEIKVSDVLILSAANELPLPVFGEQQYPEEVRLKYRFLDLRRDNPHQRIILRSKVISFLRQKMIENNFLEFQTPILTASSPEGARDFLVPSRLHPGKFYALPQAPQQFKQMVMISGFDRYFQIAPCFRDEDGRADRSPGEHYQLDMEMAFVEQEDIFKIVEPIFFDLFNKFGNNKKVSKAPFKRITYNTAITNYGTDKPDLRNPLLIEDLTELFKSEEIKLDIFKKIINAGGIVKSIKTENTSKKPRSFFDNLNKWALDQGAKGLAYINFEMEKDQLVGKGPISKFFSKKSLEELVLKSSIKEGDTIFLISNNLEEANKFSGILNFVGLQIFQCFTLMKS
jgi:aspartyl-tRNA synthetase